MSTPSVCSCHWEGKEQDMSTPSVCSCHWEGKEQDKSAPSACRGKRTGQVNSISMFMPLRGKRTGQVNSISMFMPLRMQVCVCARQILLFGFLCSELLVTTVVVFCLWWLRMGLNIYFCTACQALFSCQRSALGKLHFIIIIIIIIVTCTGAKLCQDLQCSIPPFCQHAGHYKSYVDSSVHQHPTVCHLDHINLIKLSWESTAVAVALPRLMSART